MSSSKRFQDEPVWLLHHRPFRDSSRILDILSRDHGRVALVARGVRSAKSRLRGILMPFNPLQLSWVIRSDLGTMTGAEMNGRSLVLTGDALLSGYYLNELLLNLLHRHDPQPGIFSIYSETLARLSTGQAVAASLRYFELELLRMLGYAPNLDHDTVSGKALRADGMYQYRIEEGPVPVSDPHGPMVFTGAELIAIGARAFDRPEVVHNAGSLLRDIIRFHLGGKELKSRKVMMQLRQLDKRRQ